jgi:hypothetical protein
MASPYGIERDRGAGESRRQIEALRARWPLAFPAKHQDVRPLALGAAGEIAAAMGWSLPYTLGVLGRWKMAAVYCQAVLRHDQRIALDGSPAETVEPLAGRPSLIASLSFISLRAASRCIPGPQSSHSIGAPLIMYAAASTAGRPLQRPFRSPRRRQQVRRDHVVDA